MHVYTSSFNYAKTSINYTITMCYLIFLLKNLGHLTKVIGVLMNKRDFAYLKLRDLIAKATYLGYTRKMVPITGRARSFLLF